MSADSLWGEALPTALPPTPPPPQRTLKRKDGSYIDNPCLAIFGPGPEGKRCQTCAHLRCHSWDKRYYKCDLRGKPTHAPGTDHRVRWPACARYAESEVSA